MSGTVSIESLLNDLRCADARKRQGAISALLETPVVTVAVAPLPLLLQIFEDPDHKIRAVIAAALGKKRDKAAVPTLVDRVIRDSSESVRSTAARALGAIGDFDTVDALRAALFTGGEELASEAGLALRNLGSPDVVGILTEALASTNVHTRRSAAVQLKVMREPSARAALLLALADPDATVRRLSAAGLGNLQDPTVTLDLENALQDADPSVRSAALSGIVGLLGASAMPSILVGWDDSDTEVHGRAKEALEKFASIGEVPFLIQALLDHRAVRRADAAATLGAIRSRQAVRALITALQDLDGRVRFCAVQALAAIGAPDATPGLVSALKSPDREVRLEAADALGADEYSVAVPALVEALKDPDALIRAHAATALGAIGDPAALEGLDSLASDQETYDDRNTLHEPGQPPVRVGTAAKLASAKVKVAHALKTICFSACYPKEMPANVWCSAYVYMFGKSAASIVADDARTLLNKHIDKYRFEDETTKVRLRENTLISVTPRLEGFEFNPPQQSIEFREIWHRIDFRLKASEELLRKTSNGTVVITADGIIVADIPISIYVQPKWRSGLRVKSPAHETTAHAYAPYESIFCSYSHRDSAIVKRVERVCRALGMTYLRDSLSLRSGENWSEQLLAMIERADVFQLFWSENAAASKSVEKEWRHAQKLGREAERFIRPVYWSQPMPPPPPELAQLHFAFAPELGLRG